MAKILFVEDEESLQIILPTILTKNGHTVTTTCNGVEALDELRVQSFDILITDLRMPKMDGRDLIFAMRMLPKMENIPVIVMSGEFDDVQVDEIMDGENIYFLKKPFRTAILVDMVKEVCTGIGFDKEIKTS